MKKALTRKKSLYFIKCMRLLPYHYVFFPKKNRRRTPLWKKHQIMRGILEYYKTTGYNKKMEEQTVKTTYTHEVTMRWLGQEIKITLEANGKEILDEFKSKIEALHD